MAVYLSEIEIDECCLRMIEYIENNHPQYSSRMWFMYLYGCRIGELFFNKIGYDGINDKVIIEAQKGNNVRINNNIDFRTPALVEEINLTYDNFWINKRNLQRIIEVSKPYRNIYCGEKAIGAHLFRHNWVRKQIRDGKQWATIDEMLGYTKQTVQDTYAISQIYY